MRKYFLIVIVCLLTFSCTSITLVTKKELVPLTKEWKEPKVAIWYYKGSDVNYHFFKYVDLGIDKEYKIKKTEFQVENEYQLTSNKSSWHVMQWGPQGINN